MAHSITIMNILSTSNSIESHIITYFHNCLYVRNIDYKIYDT